MERFLPVTTENNFKKKNSFSTFPLTSGGSLQARLAGTG